MKVQDDVFGARRCIQFVRCDPLRSRQTALPARWLLAAATVKKGVNLISMFVHHIIRGSRFPIGASGIQIIGIL